MSVGIIAGIATSQFDTSSTMLANVPTISLLLESGKSYAIAGALIETHDAVGGFNLAFGFSGSAGRFFASAIQSVGSGFLSVAGFPFVGFGDQGATNYGTPTDHQIINVSGFISVASHGNLTLQFAQYQSGSGPSSILPGSYLTATPIG